MPTKTFLRSRALAFAHQGGRCYYCESPMWTTDPASFAAQYRIATSHTRQFRCTGEHLKERQHGGDDSTANVVAACDYCNRTRHRHRPLNAPSPTDYKRRVQKGVARGTWPCVRLLAR